MLTAGTNVMSIEGDTLYLLQSEIQHSVWDMLTNWPHCLQEHWWQMLR